MRVKRNTTAPSLVAMTATQVPIIGWENRYMTASECKRLQSMDALELPEQASRAYAALGNAVNVEVARLVAEALLKTRENHLAHDVESWDRPTVQDSSQLLLWADTRVHPSKTAASLSE